MALEMSDEHMGALSRLKNLATGGSAGAHNRNSYRSSPLEDLYLSQLVPALLLVVYGIIVIYSASLTLNDANFPRHVIGVVLGLGAALVVWRFDYRALANMSVALLVLDALLMIMPRIPGLGYSAKGISGWVKLPFVGLRFQPSEIAKLVTIFLMASLTAQYNGKIETLKDYVKLCAALCVPFFLILVQPDLGTGLIILVTGATIIICGGARKSWVLFTIALIIAGAALVVISSMTEGMPHILKQYQINRLVVFVDPSADPESAYNLQQAKIAVGSGGLLGKGIGNASQSASGFLPEAHTDFVFALLAEEFGFLGCMVLLGLYGWMLFSTIFLAMRLDLTFSKLVLVGCAAMWTFQLLQEVGMCIGIMPITGIPLPFISFGSTSMVVQLMAVGIVQSVWCHRPKTA